MRAVAGVLALTAVRRFSLVVHSLSRVVGRVSRVVRTVSLVVCALGLVTGPALAARLVEGGRISIHYKNAGLAQIVEEIARATGEPFTFDRALPGRFTITISRPVTRQEALAVLDATLMMQGYAILRGDDGVNKVLPVTDAATGSAWAGPGSIGNRDKFVTTMIHLERSQAEKVLANMQHLVSPQDRLVAYPATNSLILVGSEKRVRNMLELARALDAGGLGELWIRTLRHRGVLEASELLREAVDQTEYEAAREEPLRIVPDERTNTLILMGSDSQLSAARSFIEKLDEPPVVNSRVRVVRIYHREASDLEQTLIRMAVGRAINAQDPSVGENLLGRVFMVIADDPTNSLVIDADPGTFAAIMRLLDLLDRPPPRVQVDVIAYEVTNPTQMRLGVDWFLPVIVPDNAQDTAMTITSNPSGGGLRGQQGDDITFFGRASRDPLLIPFVDDAGQPIDIVLPRETVVVTANDRAVRTRVLMRPRLMMISGEEQRIFAGQNVPILVGETQEAGSALSGVQTRSSIQREDVGVELRVTPHIGDQGKVRIDIALEISRVVPSVAGNVNSVGPTLARRQIETTIDLADGELAVIGMSQDGSELTDQSGTPFLMDIPILGHLVKSGGNSRVDSHLVFTVQARILTSHDEDLAESIRQRLALERSLSRVSGLRRNPDAPYAVLVATRGSRALAQAIVDSFELEGEEAQIGAWNQMGEERFDVYLTGYVLLDDAGAASLLLRERGWAPEVVVLPGETEIAKTPGLRLLGSRLEVSQAAGAPAGAAPGDASPVDEMGSLTP